ncbi:sigma-70 family RNA polymerase sigma factor [Nocardioides alcanivorans]|uniref:sigma-70 family RNA polymerase sigma factor n=1 Tax=Nocardioides alcanivorans TaxID=2897352 RepID=UPI001F3679F3|nr:sigma-70 family RNA polymerase sigma factor [Nocardioides alcanivorans]
MSADFDGRSSQPSDDELVRRVREGDDSAFGVLYERHRGAAEQVARAMVRGADMHQDLVAEAFASVLDKLKQGLGPSTNFQAYLFACIRNGFRQHLRQPAIDTASDRPWLLDASTAGPEELVSELTHDAAAKAFASLPDSWRSVLWKLEVEGQGPSEVAHSMGTSPAAVSALVYRAREGLRRAYLTQHLPAVVSRGCNWTVDRLPQFVRGDLGASATSRIDQHLVTCPTCRAALEQLEQVNSRMGAVVWPLVLVGGLPGFVQALPRPRLPLGGGRPRLPARAAAPSSWGTAARPPWPPWPTTLAAYPDRDGGSGIGVVSRTSDGVRRRDCSRPAAPGVSGIADGRSGW